jgi:protease I
MKRLTILLILTMCFAVLCFGQRRPRISQRKIIQLTEPQITGTVSVEQALASQQNVSKFDGQALKREQIGQLAWAGQGIINEQKGLRTAPTIASIYPLELVFATDEGVFGYQPDDNSFEQISEQDIRSILESSVTTQTPISGAGCAVVVAGAVRKLTTQFGNRSRIYMSLEAGRAAQNIRLQAVAMELGSISNSQFDSRNVAKICGLTRTFDPLTIVFIGNPAGQEIYDGQTISTTKKAVFIIAGQHFREDELFPTKQILDAAQISTDIASTKLGLISGSLGRMAEATVLVDQLNVDDYDAVIFTTGPGTIQYIGNTTIMNIIRDAVRKNKVLAAIGVAPVLLADAGVLNGVQATSYITEQQRLVQSGAIYTGAPVTQDRLIITATDPQAAMEFGRVIVNTLMGL